MISFDITMTAVLRPEIIYKTLKSFTSNFLSRSVLKNSRLIINVDPVGGNRSEIVGLLHNIDSICSYFFGNRVIFRIPDKPNFSAAFKWVWEQVTADYVLHLEDDWGLVRQVSPQKVVNVLNSEQDLALLRLPMFRSGSDTMKNWNKYFPWNGKYFECPSTMKRGVGFCGHPSIIKREFVEAVTPFIDTTRNPEKQFHRGPIGIMNVIDRYRYGVWGPQNFPPAIVDLGRAWLRDTQWQKKGTKAFFTEWEKT